MMQDFRPVGFVIGRLAAVLGATMLIPAAFDLYDGDPNAARVALAAALTWAAGLALSFATRERERERKGLTRRQAFLLTTLVWAALPLFGALPFVLGAPNARFVDAYFEAMSGLTTTGATVFSGLDEAPAGMLLWRGMLQWFGGVGIVVVAIVFLPALRIGGMQFFRSESFDLSGDTLPRATEIAASLAWIYGAITLACLIAYATAGLAPFDALVHAMTTVATGGYSNYDTGFAELPDATHWVAVGFMLVSALPFIRYVQLARGNARPLLHDPQIRVFLAIVGSVSLVITAYLVVRDRHEPLDAAREAFFNATSVMTGTGYASDPYDTWGGLAVGLLFILALIGGCTGSTACSAKVFRYQVLLAALSLQIRRIHSPHAVYLLRYDGRAVEAEVVTSIMGFFFVFFTALAVWSILLSLQGLDFITAVSASVAALCNLGPGFGPQVGPNGNFAGLPDASKWLLSLGMLLGRLEFLSALVLLSPLFWRR
ncbi:MAG: TrkH family potassium uptake protein [Paracoccaceae bacterium]